MYLFVCYLTLKLLLSLGTHALETVSSLTGQLQGTKYIEACTVWVNNLLANKEHLFQAHKEKKTKTNTSIQHKTSQRERGILGVFEETEKLREEKRWNEI